jgi:hypothetical protein
VADFARIHWPICSGFGGRFTPESLADLHRIMQLAILRICSIAQVRIINSSAAALPVQNNIAVQFGYLDNTHIQKQRRNTHETLNRSIHIDVCSDNSNIGRFLVSNI